MISSLEFFNYSQDYDKLSVKSQTIFIKINNEHKI